MRRRTITHNLIYEITERILNMILNESYNSDNFFKNTQAVFVNAKHPNREPDYVSTDRNGYASSNYWYTNEGVYRMSSHWSLIYYNSKRCRMGNGSCYECFDIASCFWLFDTSNDYNANCGFCPWSDFLPFNGKDLNLEALENKMKHKVWGYW